jgi:hypothetical protein
MTNRRAAKKGRGRANRLDYGLLPEPESTPTFTSLPEELEAAMQRLPRTLRRMEAALSSAREIDSFREGGARAQRRAESAFRSALTEYIAIEDTFKRERPAGTPPFRLLDTTNPLPHILRLLRHLQTHHTASELSGITISLWLKNVPGAEPQDVPVRVISDLTETNYSIWTHSRKATTPAPRRGRWSTGLRPGRRCSASATSSTAAWRRQRKE